MSHTRLLPSEQSASGHSHIDAIDGLRTCAVLSVMAFHFGLPVFGGFIGVDAFFVLSGFLITSLLLKDVERFGRVDLKMFWVRRIRRLIPAMLIMVIAVVVFAYFVEPINNRLSLGQDVYATLTYLANWHFIAHSSYFANDGTVSPLLHMWSLAVEEQFYIVWPIAITFIAAVTKRRNQAVLFVSCIVVFASAFWMAHLWVQTSPERAYMGTDSRAFQLAMGSVLAALVHLRPSVRGTWTIRTFISTIGLITLGTSTFVMGSKEGPTNIYAHGGAVAVGLAAAVVIWSMWAGDGAVATFMASPLMGYLGRISYAMYLWHWPLQVYVHKHLPHFTFHNNILQALILTLMTIGLATVSYYLVEMPLRTRGPLVKARPWKILVTIPLVLITTAFASSQALARIPSSAIADGNNKVIMLVGDSVPMRLATQFDAYATTQGWHVVSAAKGSCPALAVALVNPDGTPYGPGEKCREIRQLQQGTLAKYKPSVVIWMSRYEISDRLTTTNKHISPTEEKFWTANTQDLQAQVKNLTASNAHLVFVPIEPSGMGMYSRCTSTSCHWFLKRLISAQGTKYQNRWNGILKNESARHAVTHYFSINEFVCRNKKSPCNDTVNGKLARPDGTHYTPDGGSEFIPQLVDYAIAQATK